MKHTKGPWNILCGFNIRPDIVSANGIIATMHQKTDTANARLIAAAPELLKACVEAYNFINEKSERSGKDILNQLKYIIEKAERNES